MKTTPILKVKMKQRVHFSHKGLCTSGTVEKIEKDDITVRFKEARLNPEYTDRTPYTITRKIFKLSSRVLFNLL